ncbi:MAG: universal stress protein [Syntrophomonadaceae bacterium]|nr:universal stress protein [Syntrophomonadaceae bacterium]
MYKRVLIALDGSAPSFRAVSAAAKMSASIEEITLINVVTIQHVFSADGQSVEFFPSEYYQELMQNAHEVLDKAEAMLDKHPRVTKIVESGPPAEIILQLADKDHYDLIIVGSRGLNTLERLFLGSVGHKVVSLANCPVMLVK